MAKSTRQRAHPQGTNARNRRVGTPAIGAPDESVPRRPVAPLDRILRELERDRADP